MAKLVIVEDDQLLGEMYVLRLEAAGYQCFHALDGKTGLALIEQQLPDLVLLDLMLPEISGDEVLRQMRNSTWGKNIKVIILTNISESEAPEGLDELGFESYLVKANHTSAEVIDVVDKTLAGSTSAK